MSKAVSEMVSDISPFHVNDISFCVVLAILRVPWSSQERSSQKGLFGGKMVHLWHPGSVKKAREGSKIHNNDGAKPDRVFDGVLDDLGLPEGSL